MENLNLGNRLKEARKGKKMSQSKLANLVGLTTKAVSRLETNKDVYPDNILVLNIASHLGCTADYLLGIDIDKSLPIEEPKIEDSTAQEEIYATFTVLLSNGSIENGHIVNDNDNTMCANVIQVRHIIDSTKHIILLRPIIGSFIPVLINVDHIIRIE